MTPQEVRDNFRLAKTCIDMARDAAEERKPQRAVERIDAALKKLTDARSAILRDDISRSTFGMGLTKEEAER